MKPQRTSSNNLEKFARLKIGDLLQNRYRLDAELGRGGMGVVYRAHDTLLDRDIAVKLLSATAFNDESRARLLREAQAAAKLNHPHIVAVHDAGVNAGVPFIVMELVEGKSLHDQPPQSLEEVIEIARQICAALDHAHAHGVIHRDLKPENVLMTSDGGAKLMDFGLARSVAARLSSEVTIVGTVFYLAPEQALGKLVDSRADLYALGVVLYELTTGRLPFTGDDPLAVISQHLYAPVVPPRTYRADLSPALDALIIKLLAKNPDDRFASARDVASALEIIATPQPSAPAPPAEAMSATMLLQQLARGRLVGRQKELKQLRELWARAQEGNGLLALISGEPGVGKTRLANELLVYAQLNGATMLRGGCYEYEATTPYMPFVEALREWVHAQNAEALRTQVGSTAAELAKLAPEIESKLGPLAPNPALPPEEERLRLFDNVARFLQTLAQERGLFLFIDDLHWADQGTLSLLHYLLRHLRRERVLILAAYREVELDRTHPLAGALVEWNRERLATRISLGRLSLDETGALLATLFGQASVSQEFAQAMYRETEGNPFFIEEVVKSLIEQGQIYREGDRWQRKEIAELTIPQSVKEAIGRRLNHLNATCIDVLHTAAALGKTFAFRELVEASAPNEEQLLNALDDACATQLIRAASGDAFEFTHDKIREVLYEELNPVRRRRLHQRIGEGLEKLYAQPPTASPLLDIHVQDLAHHFTESGDLSKGLQYSLLAARKAERLFAHDDALRYYAHARESAEALNSTERLAEIYEAIGAIYSLRGPVNLAVENYERALALATTREKRGALKSQIGRDYAQVGDARGLENTEAALQELDPKTQTNERALATAMLGRYHHYRGQHSLAIEYLERARQLVEPLDDALTLTQIYAYLAGAHHHLVLFGKSIEWARRSIALGERKDYPVAMAYGYEFLAEISFSLGKWKDAIEFANRDREIAEKIGSQARIAWAHFSRAHALHGLGDLRAASESARLALTLAEGIGDQRLAAIAGAILSVVETDQALDEAARADAELALKRADEVGQILMQCISRNALAYWYVQAGEWERAIELYDECDELLAPTENRIVRLVTSIRPAEAHLGLGHVDQATKIIDSFLALARDVHSRHYEAVAQCAQGQIFAAQKAWDDAARAFDQAIEILGELGSRLELGRAFYHRGLVQARSQVEAARIDLSRAHEIFEQCGAVRDRERAEKFLDAMSAF